MLMFTGLCQVAAIGSLEVSCDNLVNVPTALALDQEDTEASMALPSRKQKPGSKPLQLVQLR